MAPLFVGLPVKVLRQHGQVITVEVGRHGDVAQRGSELVADLGVQRRVHSGTQQHRDLLSSATTSRWEGKVTTKEHKQRQQLLVAPSTARALGRAEPAL